MIDAFFRLLGRLPLRVLHRVGAWLGPWAYRLSGDFRHKVDHFSAQAGYASPAFRRATLQHIGRGFAEIPWLWTRPTEVTTAGMRAEGWDLVEAAWAAGRGIIFLTPHMGCFEITAQYYARFRPISVLYSPPRQPWVRRIVDAARARPNLGTAPASLSGVRQLVRALKRGEAVGILPDQVPGAQEGVWAPFFDRPAYTMTLPARLQQASGAVVLLAWGERLPKGAGFCLHLYPFEDTFAAEPAAQARQINAAMEQLIRRAPEQYMWAYNRFKIPAGATPPDASSSTAP